MIKGGSDLVIGVTGAAGFIVLAIVDLIIFLVLKQKQRFTPGADNYATD